jgi:hypothetical protein
VKDHEGLAQETSQAVALGFAGKAAIHPNQIAAINAALTPRGTSSPTGMLAGPKPTVINAKVAADPLGEDKPPLPAQPFRLVDLAVCFARQDEWFLQPRAADGLPTGPVFGKRLDCLLRTPAARKVLVGDRQPL